jgi:hypothetical protein
MYKNTSILLLGALLFACNSGGDSGERTRASFCADWARSACSKETVSACQAPSQAACEGSQAKACLKLVPEEFSDSKGSACIDAVKAAYDDGDLRDAELATVFRLAGPCAAIVRGPGDMGDECSSTRDCNAPGGLMCVRKGSDKLGECQVPVEVAGGRDCSAANKVCGAGFYCDGNNCIEAKSAGRDCTNTEECTTGLFCNPTGKCEAGRGVSASCTDDIQCSTGICLGDADKMICTDRVVLARSEPVCDDLR